MIELPTGTVTFLLTDIEGSTRLWERDATEMAGALARHDALVQQAVEGAGGRLVKSRGEGDSVFAVFSRARDGVAAAAAIQRAMAETNGPDGAPLKVRMALHSGEAELRAGDYYGPVVNRCARLRAVASGGQTLLSEATAQLVAEGLPDGLRLQDLGEHRLRDLSRPERIYAVTDETRPAEPVRLQTPAAGNLPLQLTNFVGRERELQEVCHLGGQERLVTLLGPGGAGKTRLALEAAGRLLAENPDGAWLVDLSGCRDPGAAAEATAAALRVSPEPGRETPQVIAGQVGSRRLLLLLDSCEHLLDAVAPLADLLLRACPHLTLLATSREPLGIQGEAIFRVLALQPTDALRLFAERARLARPGFMVDATNEALVGELCRRLDGIPLALELAAARLRALPLGAIVERLEDRFQLLSGTGRTGPARHQTLEATIAWSFDLLTPAEQLVFSRLAALTGGFAIGAAETVAAGGEIAAGDVLSVLLRLVDRSLIELDEGGEESRYRLAETIRQYGFSRLVASGEAVETLLRVAAEASGRQDHGVAFAALRDALRLLPAGGERRTDLLDQLAWHAERTGDYAAGIAALREMEVGLPTSELARRAQVQLRLSSFLPMATGDFGAAKAAAATAVRLFGEAGQHDRALAVTNELAWIDGLSGDFGAQAAAARQVIAEAERSGDETLLMHACGTFTFAGLISGDIEEALAIVARGLLLARRLNDAFQVAWFAMGLAYLQALTGRLHEAASSLGEIDRQVPEAYQGIVLCHLLAGDFGQARDEARTGTGLFRDVALDSAYILSMAGWAHAELGEAEMAASYLEKADRLYGQREFFIQSRFHRWAKGVVAWCRGDLTSARGYLAEGARVFEAAGDVVFRSLILYDLAEVARGLDLPDEEAAARSTLSGLAGRAGQLAAWLAAPPSTEVATALESAGYRAYAGRVLVAAGGDRNLARADELFESTGARWRQAKGVDDARLLGVDRVELLRFLEASPAAADRLLTLVRREEGRPAHDLAGRLTAAIQHLSEAESRAVAQLELLPLFLEGENATFLEPLDAGSWLVPAQAAEDPGAVVRSALRGADLEVWIVHSTSWRFAPAGLVLTYVALLPAAPATAHSGLRARPVIRRDLARGGAADAPATIQVDQVVEHALRHLAWLAGDDPVIAAELPDAWRSLLRDYQPEPFRAL